jgi:hypothetical protein
MIILFPVITGVEQSTHIPNIKGLNPANGTGREKNKIKKLPMITLCLGVALLQN